MRFIGLFSGQDTPPSAGSNSTLMQSMDIASETQSFAAYRETTAGQGSRPVGATADSDDVAACYLAIRESNISAAATNIVIASASIKTGGVEFGSQSESHAGDTGSVSESSFNWDHFPVGIPAGVLIFIFSSNADSASLITSVTYDGTTVPAVSGGFAKDTTGEKGFCAAYFLGSGVPTPPVSADIVVTRTNNTTELYAISVTVFADDDTEVTGILLEQEDQALTEENIDDGSPGSNSLRFCGLYSGSDTVISQGSNSTQIANMDFGDNHATAYLESVHGQGSRPVGPTNAASDDVAAVYLAIRQSGLDAAAINIVSAGSELATARKIDASATNIVSADSELAITIGEVITGREFPTPLSRQFPTDLSREFPQIGGGAAVPMDDFFSSVVLLLNLDGDEGDTTTVDDSNSAHPVEFVDNAELDTGVTLFGESTLLLDGTDDVLKMPDSNDFSSGANDFTIELWLNRNSDTNGVLISKYNATTATAEYFLRYDGTELTYLSFFGTGGSSFFLFSGSWDLGTNSWHPVAITRAADQWRLYADGQQIAVTSNNYTLKNSTQSLWIGGRNHPTPDYFDGNFKSIRLTSLARYTDSSYTIPTSSFPTR